MKPNEESIKKALFTISEALGFEPVDLSEKKDDELLPCPFCGNSDIFRRDVYVDHRTSRWTLRCWWCGVMVANSRNDSMDDLVKLWNKRAKL